MTVLMQMPHDLVEKSAWWCSMKLKKARTRLVDERVRIRWFCFWVVGYSASVADTNR